MNGMRKVISLVFALLIMAFSVPGLAQKTDTKYFWATFPETLQAPVSTIDMTIYNATPPPGVSTINSGRIRLFGGAGMRIVGVQMVLPTVSPVSMTASSDGTDIVITNFPGIKNNKSATFRLTLAGAPTTCTGVTWVVNANTGNAYPGGDEFVPTGQSQLNTGVGCDGILDCETTGSGGTFQFGQTGITGKRGDNKDISACVKVPYDLIDNRSATRSVEFKWDYAAQPGAAFEITVPWNPELADATTGMPKPTKLNWLVNGDYMLEAVPGRACINNSLPKCLGKLGADVAYALSGTPGTITVVAADGCTVPTETDLAPFAITIDRERMLVTAISGETWNVMRGDGRTETTAHPAVRSNGSITKVASNPLPLDSEGKQMQMCIKEESFKSSALGAELCNESSGPICSFIEVTTTVFDLGDGLMIR